MNGLLGKIQKQRKKNQKNLKNPHCHFTSCLVKNILERGKKKVSKEIDFPELNNFDPKDLKKRLGLGKEDSAPVDVEALIKKWGKPEFLRVINILRRTDNLNDEELRSLEMELFLVKEVQLAELKEKEFPESLPSSKIGYECHIHENWGYVLLQEVSKDGNTAWYGCHHKDHYNWETPGWKRDCLPRKIDR